MRLLISSLFVLAPALVHAADLERCVDNVGRKLAERLADQCRMVSPATNPPCSSDNTCDVVMSEIRRGCLMLADDKEPAPADSPAFTGDTAFCKDYLEIAGEAKPSFDCAKAATQIEKTICASVELAELDVWLADIYARGLRSETTSADEQRAWLKARDQQCGAAADAACLKTAMKARIDALRLSEQGLTPLPAGPQLKYADLIGTWESKAVRLFGDGISAIGYDDDKYRNMVVKFSADKIEWIKGTERSPIEPRDNCAAPKLAAEISDEEYYKVPGGQQMKCGAEGWGPGEGAVLRRLNTSTVQLYWYDSAILTLKRVR